MYHGERFNSWTHLIGTVLAIVGTVHLLAVSAQYPNVWKVVSFSVFGASLITLYLASTLYHSTTNERRKRHFALADHCAIYLLIAGTYTPFCLVTLHGALGWGVLAALWALAALGVGRELIWRRHAGRPLVLLYVAMGWCGIVVIWPLSQRLAHGGLVLLGLGAALYTVGTIFFLRDQRWRHAHGIWHLFVLAGSASHYFTMLYFVA